MIPSIVFMGTHVKNKVLLISNNLFDASIVTKIFITENILPVTKWYVSRIKSYEEWAKLFAIPDYMLNKTSNNYKYPTTYFIQ